MQTTTVRKHFLITLENKKNQDLKAEDLRDRILSLFTCRVIAIAKKKGGSITIGVFSKNASKHTFRKKLKTAFSDLIEEDFHVECRKAWSPVCQALNKAGQQVLLVWGEGRLFEIEGEPQKKIKGLSDAPKTEKKKGGRGRPKKDSLLKKEKSSLFLPGKKSNKVLSFMRKTKEGLVSLVVKFLKNLLTRSHIYTFLKNHHRHLLLGLILFFCLLSTDKESRSFESFAKQLGGFSKLSIRKNGALAIITNPIFLFSTKRQFGNSEMGLLVDYRFI